MNQAGASSPRPSPPQVCGGEGEGAGAVRGRKVRYQIVGFYARRGAHDQAGRRAQIRF